MEKFKRRREAIENMRPIDDVFFEVMAQDKGVCEEILQVILEDSELKVLNNVPQKSIRNLQGRSVKLDALCVLGDGRRCNVEVQKADSDNHLKRVRYHSACITAGTSDTGTDFSQVPTVYIVYITKFDIFKKGKTIYHIKKIVEETGEIIDDGAYEIFVNTAVVDNTDIS